VYIQSASSSNVIVGKEYLTSLEERLKAAEENILSLQTSQSRQQQHLRFEDVDELVPNDAHGENTNRELLPLTNNIRPADGSEATHVITLDDETNELGTVIFSVEENCGFFGKYCRALHLTLLTEIRTIIKYCPQPPRVSCCLKALSDPSNLLQYY
jgi:hypothetical protein